MMVTEFFAACVLLVACANASGQPVIKHGIMKLDGKGNATLVTVQPLPKGSDVSFQYPGPDSKPRCCKRMRSAEFAAVEDQTESVSNEAGDGAGFVSRGRTPKAWPKVSFIGAAAIGRHVTVKMNRRQGLTVLDGRRVLARSETCVSQEGFHLMVKTKGQESTHLYLGLGYDVESPTCPTR